MSKKLLVEEMDGITTIRFTRKLTLEETLEMMDEMVQQGTTNRRLWDVGKHFNLSAEDIRKIAEHGKKIWPDPARVAYVTDGDLTFGLVRMLEAFRAQDNYRTKVFRDEAEAREWLLAGED